MIAYAAASAALMADPSVLAKHLNAAGRESGAVQSGGRPV